MVSRLVMTVVELASARIFGRGGFEGEDGGGGAGRHAVADQDQMTGHDAVAALEAGFGGERLAIEHGAVLAAEIDDGPDVAFAFHQHVLAREAVIVGVAEGDGGGPAEAETIAVERDRTILAIRGKDLEFFHCGDVTYYGISQGADPTGVRQRWLEPDWNPG